MKRRKVNANKLMGILLFFLLITLGTCLFLKSDFFYLEKVEINNNYYLEKNQIEELLSIDMNKNIFFYDLKNLEQKIERSSYVKDCEIKRKLPNKLIVNMEEKNIIGPIYNGKTYSYIDDKGKLVDEIEKIKEDEIQINFEYTLNNESIELNKDDKNKLIKLYSKLKNENMLNEIKIIDFNDKDIIRMITNSGINVKLVKDDNIEKNISKLGKVLVDLHSRKETYGNIDLTYNSYILYSKNDK